jgi:hypothetical protein
MTNTPAYYASMPQQNIPKKIEIDKHSSLLSAYGKLRTFKISLPTQLL